MNLRRQGHVGRPPGPIPLAGPKEELGQVSSTPDVPFSDVSEGSPPRPAPAIIGKGASTEQRRLTPGFLERLSPPRT